MAVARGPPSDAVDAWLEFTGTFAAPHPDSAQLKVLTCPHMQRLLDSLLEHLDGRTPAGLPGRCVLDGSTSVPHAHGVYRCRPHAQPGAQASLQAPWPPFSVLRVAELVPEHKRQAYEDLDCDDF